MKWYRPQRGGYEESMALKCRVNSRTDLAHCLGVSRSQITIKPYCFDDRNGWDTHLVSVNGQAVGFLSGSLDRDVSVTPTDCTYDFEREYYDYWGSDDYSEESYP